MFYSDIKTCDIANGPGVRVTIFVSGCTHHCKGCFNEVTWNFQYGREFTEDTIEEILQALAPDYITGLTLLGGDPLEYVNQKGLLPLVRAVKEQYPQKDIWCYSGYLFDEQIVKDFCNRWEETRELLGYLDVLVDGKFIEEQKNISLQFKGSENQRIIRVQESLKSGQIVLWQPDET